MLRGPGRASDTRDPSAGVAELARVTRPDGAVLATVFSTTSHDPARDQIDAFAQDADWQIPAWYTELKTTAVPILGSLRWKRGVVRAASSRGRCHCQATNPPAQTAPAPTITPAAISTRRSSSAAAAPE